ncbi:protein of unknown function [Candidatus Filomicrobium marinum]|uniref:Uncharacterized protein n=1 Tax=Candidatus Filomicrobium marinum TaxID=1608628 RepID=A0A0D6JFD1_9HYPH|nr:protein of unknown function [Candidatus Filomicrobium marinum]CPR18590.1 protein of unknown function [Candidatus Filomicrobium marinum]
MPVRSAGLGLEPGTWMAEPSPAACCQLLEQPEIAAQRLREQADLARLVVLAQSPQQGDWRASETC